MKPTWNAWLYFKCFWMRLAPNSSLLCVDCPR